MKLAFGVLLTALIVAVAVVISGVVLVTAKHKSRQLFAELEALKREEARLQDDWGRLQLEQSTWATHPRIEALAAQQLELVVPDEEQVVIVAAPGQ